MSEPEGQMNTAFEIDIDCLFEQLIEYLKKKKWLRLIFISRAETWYGMTETFLKKCPCIFSHMSLILVLLYKQASLHFFCVSHVNVMKPRCSSWNRTGPICSSEMIFFAGVTWPPVFVLHKSSEMSQECHPAIETRVKLSETNSLSYNCYRDTYLFPLVYLTTYEMQLLFLSLAYFQWPIIIFCLFWKASWSGRDMRVLRIYVC